MKPQFSGLACFQAGGCASVSRRLTPAFDTRRPLYRSQRVQIGAKAHALSANGAGRWLVMSITRRTWGNPTLGRRPRCLAR